MNFRCRRSLSTEQSIADVLDEFNVEEQAQTRILLCRQRVRPAAAVWVVDQVLRPRGTALEGFHETRCEFFGPARLEGGPGV